MRSHYQLILVFAVGLLPLSQARADTSSRELAKSRKIMFDYAACVIKGHHDSASEVLVSNVGPQTIIKRFPGLINRECMGSVASNTSMTFKDDLFRYALADALVNADFRAVGPTSFADKLPLAPFSRATAKDLATKLAETKSKKVRAEVQENFEKAAAMAWLSTFGECVARRDPVASRLWLLTRPDGPEEMSRINAMRPAFVDCMDVGGSLKFGKVVLRGVVAINYYRLAMATPQPIPGKTQ